MRVETATPGDVPAVRNVLDGALLELDGRALADAVEDDEVLVAVRDAEDGDVVLGALVLDGTEILAVAVRPRLRGQGIGTALVEAAAERRERLEAEFHERVRPFWESLDFTVEPTAETARFRGRRPS